MSPKFIEKCGVKVNLTRIPLGFSTLWVKHSRRPKGQVHDQVQNSLSPSLRFSALLCPMITPGCLGSAYNCTEEKLKANLKQVDVNKETTTDTALEEIWNSEMLREKRDRKPTVSTPRN